MTARLAQTVRRFSHPFTVERYDAGEYIEGRWSKGEPRRFEASGSIQPATTDEIQVLPEGTRSEGAITIWTECDLRIGSLTDENQTPDHVFFGGIEYEVRAEADWFHHGAFRRYVAAKAGQ